MNPPEYRTSLTASIANSTRTDLHRWRKAMLAHHPKGKPHKPKVGTVLDRLVDFAKANGFNPSSSPQSK